MNPRHPLIALFIVCVLSATSAKGHRGKLHHPHGTATQSPDGKSAYNDGEQRKELHRSVTSPMDSDGADDRASSVSQAPSVSEMPALKRVKKVFPADKDFLHKNAQEHNVNKKQLDDQDGIPMEAEFLIHVTPNPPNARKGKKSQAQKHRAANSKAKTTAGRDASKIARSDKEGFRDPSETVQKAHRNKQRQNMALAKKGQIAGLKRAAKGNGKIAKSHRYPKKYNPQKHNWKKNQKEKKPTDRKKEKRDKKSEKKDKREKRNKRMKTTNKGNEKKN